MRLLVSVRSAAEAETAVAGGADIIDAKEPLRGSLGPVSPEVLRRILERVPPDRPASAALGDWGDAPSLRLKIESLPLGSSRPAPLYLKMGFAGVRNPERVASLIRTACAAAEERSQVAPVIAVAYADSDMAGTAPPEAIADAAISSGAAGLLLDTQTKGRTNLFSWMDPARVRRLFSEVRRSGLLTAAAGSLGLEHLETVSWTEPDIVGFRGAVCDDGRNGRVSLELLQRIRRAVPETSAFLQ
jgi:(5-formylfuran-3-yl)methyl phosphate synthase